MEKGDHINSKERVLTVLGGGVPDRVPFAPNIGQWFSYHKHSGTLPPELEGCEDELDAMLRMGTDIFSRRLGSFFAQSIPGVEVHRYYGNVAKGVTTALDAGSSGARTIPAFRRYVLERSGDM